MQNEVKVTIGGITLNAVTEQPGVAFAISTEYEEFEDPSSIPGINLRYHCGSEPSLPEAVLGFDAGSTWRLYRQGESFVIRLFPDSLETINPKPHRLAIMDPSFSSGEVYVWPRSSEAARTDHPGSPDQQVFLDPFAYPLPELLLMNFLGPKEGVILHACGVVDQGRGMLFVGVSGAGKSTTAELWKKTAATLLSDDRIIVHRKNGRFRMYGTPWHGDAGVASPESAPLEKLFIIQHATKNYLKPLTPIDAASRLLVRCFPPFYDRSGMQYTLDLLGKIATETPCYELGFVPDDSIVDFVRDPR